MKTILHNGLIAGTLLALAATFPSVAQTAGQSQNQAQSGTLPSSVVRGKKLDNAKVFTTQGEQMGTIEDVLIDPKTGQISHAVLGIGGWLGIGEKRVIVPWQLIQQDAQRPENFVVNADKDKLRGAPSFEGDQWAAVTQPDYLRKVQSYFGLPAQQQTSGSVAQQSSSQQGQGQPSQAQAQQEQQKQAQQARQQAVQSAQEAARQAQQQSEQAQQQLQQAQQRAQQAAERAKQTQQAVQQTQQQQQQGAQVGTPQ